jgi:hypothetical protein
MSVWLVAPIRPSYTSKVMGMDRADQGTKTRHFHATTHMVSWEQACSVALLDHHICEARCVGLGGVTRVWKLPASLWWRIEADHKMRLSITHCLQVDQKAGIQRQDLLYSPYQLMGTAEKNSTTKSESFCTRNHLALHLQSP